VSRWAKARFLAWPCGEQGELNLWKLADQGLPSFLPWHVYAGNPGYWPPRPTLPPPFGGTFLAIVRPYLLRRLGVASTSPLGLRCRPAFTWSKPGNRMEYLRACLHNGQVIPAGNQSSGVLSAQ